jgi:hypothetical protein
MGSVDELRPGLVLDAPAAGGESDEGAWFATLRGERVVVKRAALAALDRYERLAALMDRLRSAGLPVPAFRLLPDEQDLVVVQSLLPGRIPGAPDRALIEDVMDASALLAGISGAPPLNGQEWPALLRHSLLIGEVGWCRHEPMRSYSTRTRALLEQGIEAGHCLDVGTVPTTDPVHLDLHPANLLVQQGRLSGIVDWDAALQGDRWFDLLYFAHHADGWWGSRPDDVAPLWEAIEAARPAALLRAYAAHAALRTVEWQVSRHGAADADRALLFGERLLARFE